MGGTHLNQVRTYSRSRAGALPGGVQPGDTAPGLGHKRSGRGPGSVPSLPCSDASSEVRTVPEAQTRGSTALFTVRGPPWLFPGWAGRVRASESGCAPGNSHPRPAEPFLVPGTGGDMGSRPTPTLSPTRSHGRHAASGWEDTGRANTTEYRAESISPKCSLMRY